MNIIILSMLTDQWTEAFSNKTERVKKWEIESSMRERKAKPLFKTNSFQT